MSLLGIESCALADMTSSAFTLLRVPTFTYAASTSLFPWYRIRLSGKR